MPVSKANPAFVAVQERDVAVLQGLLEARVMALSHIAALYFEDRDEAAKKRVQKLKAVGFIAERPRRVNEPAILFLTRKGLAALEAEGAVLEHLRCSPDSLMRRVNVSPLRLRHELEVMDVKAAFARGFRHRDGLELKEFCTVPSLHSFESWHPQIGNRPIQPDGFIRVHEPEPGTKGFEYAFFLEVDRSTETQDTLAVKAHCYVEYFRSGGFAAKHGANRDKYKDFPFRVLIVCKSEERRDNAARRFLKNTPPIRTQVWLTTFAEITAQPFGAIWLRPLDYEMAENFPFPSKKALFAPEENPVIGE